MGDVTIARPSVEPRLDISPPVTGLVEPKVAWPALELGSLKLTRPTLELVARPPLDARMLLALWLVREPGTALGLLGNRGRLELAWVLERVTLGVLSTFVTASACCFRY